MVEIEEITCDSPMSDLSTADLSPVDSATPESELKPVVNGVTEKDRREEREEEKPEGKLEEVKAVQSNASKGASDDARDDAPNNESDSDLSSKEQGNKVSYI